jgi:hypothetical protein
VQEVLRRVQELERKHSHHDQLLLGFTDDEGVWHDGVVQTTADIRRLAAGAMPWLKGGLTVIAAKSVADFCHVSLASVMKIFGG